MPNSELIDFIKASRKKGFDDIEIKSPLLKREWPLEEINEAFAFLDKPKYKNKVCINIDSKILNAIEKRAQKNLFTLSEQIEDILRRSTLNQKKKSFSEEKLDDSLVPLFSRKRRK